MPEWQKSALQLKDIAAGDFAAQNAAYRIDQETVFARQYASRQRFGSIVGKHRQRRLRHDFALVVALFNPVP